MTSARRRVRRGIGAPAGLLAALLLALVAVALPSPAQAHASLVSTDPADGDVVDTAPEQVTLTFNEPVSLAAEGNQVLDATGESVGATASAVDEVLTLDLPGELADGTYIVSWRIVSADSHPIGGGFTFSVGAPSDTAVAVPTVEASAGLDRGRQLVEGLRYLGVTGAVGLVVLAGLLLPAGARSTVLTRRLRRGVLGLGLLGIVGAWLLVGMTAAWQSGGGIADLVSTQTWSDGLGDDVAVAAGLLTLGVLVAVAATRLTSVEASTAAALGGGVLALGSLALVGHTRTYGPAWLVVGSDLVHVLTAAVWLGGLIGLVLVLLPSSQVPGPEAARTVVRFSSAAAVVVGLLVVAGLAMGWRIVGSWDALFGTSYGIVLLVKSGLVALVLLVAAWNRWRLVPYVSHGRDAADVLSRLRTTVRAEAGVVLAVVALTGVLVTQSPVDEQAAASPAAPAESAAAPEPVVLEEALGTGSATMTITPGSTGVNTVEIEVYDADGEPLEAVEPPQLALELPEVGLGPLTRPLSPASVGRYTASVDFSLPGTWQVQLSIRLSTFDNPVAVFEVEIP